MEAIDKKLFLRLGRRLYQTVVLTDQETDIVGVWIVSLSPTRRVFVPMLFMSSNIF